MGELRDRMVRDMDVRNFAPRTIESYLEGVKRLAKYYMKSPDELSDEQVQRFLVSIREERKLSPSTCNPIRSALKLFYETTLRRPCAALTVPPMRMAQKLPEILSRQEVERIIEATSTLRDRVLLMATYGGGLRVSEVVALRPGDIDQERGVMRVEQGKGRKDRYTPLAERLVSEAERYYRVYGRPEPWVFPQRSDFDAAHRCRHRTEALHPRETTRRSDQGRRHTQFAPRIRDPRIGSRGRSADVRSDARAHQCEHHDALPAHHHQAGLGTDLAARSLAARQSTRGHTDPSAHHVEPWVCRHRWWRQEK
jgi:integrase